LPTEKFIISTLLILWSLSPPPLLGRTSSAVSPTGNSYGSLGVQFRKTFEKENVPQVIGNERCPPKN
jgi:hypothetical protein